MAMNNNVIGEQWLTVGGRRPATTGAASIAMVQAVAYADVFDFPLTVAEVHRFMVGVRADARAVERALGDARSLPAPLARAGAYVTLEGREAIVERRRECDALAAAMWPKARRYGRLIARLPFVRMVAVTGALAVDNVQRGADIDYLVVTEPGRLWLCRALIIALVRAAALADDVVCPNYLLSTRALELQERSLYTAHELVQMVPLAGAPVYEAMRRLNGWSEQFLPNAAPPAPAPDLPPGPLRRAAEGLLRTRAAGLVERGEMSRKVRKFTAQHGAGAETAFCADWCKGHFGGHGQRTLDAFAERLRALGAEFSAGMSMVQSV
jgi:hypothetical protein